MIGSAQASELNWMIFRPLGNPTGDEDELLKFALDLRACDPDRFEAFVHAWPRASRHLLRVSIKSSGGKRSRTPWSDSALWSSDSTAEMPPGMNRTCARGLGNRCSIQ